MTVGLFMILYVCANILLSYPTGLLIDRFLQICDKSKVKIIILGIGGISLLYALCLIIFLLSFTWNKVLF